MTTYEQNSDEAKSCPPEELEEKKRKCWCCNNTAYFQTWDGWRFCFKHWAEDYKWGSECGLWFALKNTKIIFSNLLK